MSVLVTGISGLIGGAVAELLLARDEEVVGYDLRPPADDRLSSAAFVRGDLNDHPLLYRAFRGHGVRRVVHAGAISSPSIEPDNPFVVCRVNILGTLQVYEAARLFGVERVVNFGSIANYGDVAEGTITEETRFAPTSVYGVTKAAGDMLGAVYSADHGLDVVSLRPTGVHGPRRPSYEPTRELIRGALSGQPVRLPGSPTQPYGPVYGRDVAQAVLTVLDAPTLPRRAYNVGGGERLTLGRAAELVGRLVGEVPVDYDRPSAPGDERGAEFDLSAIQRDLGYRPEWPLERAIPDYAAWLRDHDV
ncbi:MAG TPA: NAD(P)-dependent oxidoreductase [Chloroflexota bacterium]|jgi:UDP-glucose 4-epimerase